MEPSSVLISNGFFTTGKEAKESGKVHDSKRKQILLVFLFHSDPYCGQITYIADSSKPQHYFVAEGRFWCFTFAPIS